MYVFVHVYTHMYPSSPIRPIFLLAPFAGGGDGTVYMWDWKAKKKLCKIRDSDTSVSSLSFSKDGGKLAVAVSYTWEQGERVHPADAIIIKEISEESQVRGKEG